MTKPFKVLYVCGIVPEWPEPMRPLPPIDSGAPHGNILRLVEHLATNTRKHMEITVVSATSREQTTAIARMWPADALQGSYLHVPVSDTIRRVSAQVLSRSRLLAGALRRITGTGTLQGSIYLAQIRKIYRNGAYDCVVLDDGPQFIRGLSRFVPRDKLFFYCRGDMGDSRRFLHILKTILVTNPQLADWVKSVNPRVARCEVVPNSLPPEFESVSWRPQKFATTPKTILFAGRITQVKGVKYLIQAFAKVHAAESQTRLVLAGDDVIGGRTRPSRKGYCEEMHRLAEALLPRDAVEWRGWIPGALLAEAYQKSYMAVYPSTCIEGFGMVALEAMACGTPVIASDRPGFRHLLGDGGGILVSDPTDTDELASAMLRLLRDPPLAQRLGYKGYTKARKYTAEAAANRFVDAIIGGVGIHDA